MAISKEAEMNLRQQAYDLLNPFKSFKDTYVCNPSSEEKESLKIQKGIVFIPLEPLTYAEEVAQHPKHYAPDEPSNSQDFESLRRYSLPRVFEEQLKKPFEVGFIEDIRRHDPFRDSSNKSRREALTMINEYSQRLAVKFPDFRAIMLPVVGYAIAERVYAEKNPGKSLLDKFYAWALDDLDYHNSGPCHVLATAVGRVYSMNPYKKDFDKTAPLIRILVAMENEHLHNEYFRCFPAIIKIKQQPKPVSDVEQWRPAASS